MRDVMPDIDHWYNEGREIVVVTIIETWGVCTLRGWG
jgi:hypothetical protein